MRLLTQWKQQPGSSTRCDQHASCSLTDTAKHSSCLRMSEWTSNMHLYVLQLEFGFNSSTYCVLVLLLQAGSFLWTCRLCL